MSVKSSLGGQLARAELFHSERKHVDRHAIGYTVMPVKETPRHALSSPSDEREEQAARDGEVERKLALLNGEEREILRLQSRKWMEEQHTDVPIEELEKYLEEGWSLVRQENGRAYLAGDFTQCLTYEDIGRRMGLTVAQVHRRVKSAHRKLRGVR